MKVDFKKVMGVTFELTKKYIPEICVGLGIGLVGVGVVYACKKTYDKAHQVVDSVDADLDEVFNDDTVTGAKKKVEVTKAYIRSAGKFANLYAVPASLTFGGLGLIGVGFGVLRKRYAGAVLLGSGLMTSIAEYRERVAAKIGEAEEEKLYLGITEEVITEKITDENGKTKTVKKTKVTSVDPVSKYYIRIDENWMLWNPDRENVVNKLINILNGSQCLFERKGWYSYNEMCDTFCVPECVCPEGQLLMWIYVPDKDNKIKFIGFDEQVARFLNGEQDFIILNPNFDGDKHELIPTGQGKFLEEIV